MRSFAAFAAVATGAVKHYRGPVQQGGHVTFQTKVKHHKTKSVKRFYFFDVALKCDEATFPISNRRPSSANQMTTTATSRFQLSPGSGSGSKSPRLHDTVRGV